MLGAGAGGAGVGVLDCENQKVLGSTPPGLGLGAGAAGGLEGAGAPGVEGWENQKVLGSGPFPRIGSATATLTAAARRVAENFIVS